jgi:prophage regulatory protein
MLRTLARARRQGERINELLRVPPDEVKVQAKKRHAFEAKMRAAVRRAVAEDEASRAAHQERAAERVLRVPEVMKLAGLSRATIYRLERAGRFPKRMQISDNVVGWYEREVLAWRSSRPRAR